MKKSILAAFGLAVALAFSVPLYGTTSANAAAPQAPSASQAAKPQPMKKHHHKKIHYKKNHHKKTGPATTNKPS